MPSSLTLRFDGLTATVRADATSTGGRYLLLDCEGPCGARVPTHVHAREAEWLIVLDGELAVQLDGAERVLGPGETLALPRRLPHGLDIRSPTARFLSLWDPAGFETALRGLSGEGDGEDTPLSADDVDVLLAGAGVTRL